MMERECKSVQMRLSEYIDNEIDAGERAGVELHLKQCSECRSELKRLQSTVNAVRSLPRVKAPEGLAGRIIKDTGVRPETTAGAVKIIRIWPRIAAVAATFLIISATTLLLKSPRPFPVKITETDQPYDGIVSQHRGDAVREPETARIEPEGVPGARALRAPAPDRGFRMEGDREVLAEREIFHAGGRAGQINIDQRPGDPRPLEILGKLTGIIKSAGATQIQIDMESEKASGGFELNFQLPRESYTGLVSELNKEFALQTAPAAVGLSVGGAVFRERRARPAEKQERPDLDMADALTDDIVDVTIQVTGAP